MSQGLRLNESVYPQLDAVECGLLDTLEPAPAGGNKGYYKLRCPRCDQRRAFHYPGTASVRCNRRNACGESISLADHIMEQRGVEFAEARRILIEAAGIRTSSGGVENTNRAPSLRQSLIQVLKEQLDEHPEAQRYLESRGYHRDLRKKLPQVGYFPHWRTVDSRLRAMDVDPSPLYEWNVLPSQEQLSRDDGWGMDGRVVVLWPAPDDRFFLCGRRISDEAGGPKSLYSPGADLSIPWGWRRNGRGIIWAVEGMFDRLALEAAGFPACGLGLNAVNYNQAAHIAQSMPPELGLVTDSGPAGISGALQTVERVESLGVPLRIASVPIGGDDVDAIRRDNGEGAIGEILEAAVTGGAYVARTLLTALHRRPHSRHEIHRKALYYRALLTTSSRNDLERVFRQYGWSLDEQDGQPLQLLGRLLDAGLDLKSAERVARERSGMDVQALLSANGEVARDG